MDLAKLDLQAASAAGIDVELKHPVEMVFAEKTNEATGKTYKTRAPAPLLDDDGNQVVVKIYGAESAELKASRKIHQAEFGESIQNMESDEFAQMVIEVLIDCTISWENVNFNGEPLECNRENVEMLYRNPGYDWLVKQLFAATGDKQLIPLG